MKKVKIRHLIVITVISISIALINPLKMDMNQRILASCLIFSVAMWATEAVHKSLACIFLLISFSILGKTPILGIVNFAWSPTIFLIITTTLLSVGIMKTGIVHKHVEKLFKKNSGRMSVMLLLPYAFGIILVFLIPQAFARVIIIGAILNGLLTAETEDEKKAKQALIFNGFIAITMTYMFFNNGDIVLNHAAIKFASTENPAVKESLNFSGWFLMMAPPSVVTSILAFFAVYLIFKKDLRGFKPSMISNMNYDSNSVSKSGQNISIISMAVIILFWTTESFHGIAAWIPALAGVIIMFAIKVLDKKDLKSVNPHFLLFLVTVFSIGKVLGESGITETIFKNLKILIPNANSSVYLLIIAAVVMVMHICIGSSVATMSVVLPIIIPLTQSLGYKTEIITLMTYIIVNIHFLLPFHHATVMIGTAKEYYPEKYMLRFGAVFTFITFVLLALVYLPYWSFLNLL